MKVRIGWGVGWVLFVAAAGGLRGDPANDAILAAMKLSEESNYSWTTLVTDDASSYGVDGKVVKGGCTWMRMPIVEAIARRLGRDSDTHLEAIFKDSDRFVIHTPKGWQALAELPKRHPEWVDTEWLVPMASPGFVAATPDMPADARDALATGGFPRLLPIQLPPPDSEQRRPYSNAQFALARPQDELAIIASSFSELKREGGVVTGTLTDVGARLLLVREGQSHLEPIIGAGVFRLHLKDRAVAKYQLQLEGVIVVDKKPVHVRQSSITTISDVGRTAVEIPADVRQKLQL